MELGRRQLLLGGLAARAARAQTAGAAPLIDRGFAKVTQFAPGVYVTIADVTKGDECASNGGVLAGRSGALIVEGHMKPAGAALEIEAARKVSQAAIRGAVITHFHLDHTFGNAAYAEQGIPILAHEKVTPIMKEQYAAVKAADKSRLLAPREKKVAEARDETEKKRRQQDLEGWKWTYDSIEAVKLTYPTEPLRASQLPKKVDLGGLVAVIEHHPAHTPTDLIVRVPAHNLVFTGDLLFHNAYPVTPDADMIAWRKVLDLFAGYGPRTRFVPGHGPVCGQETVREQIAIFDDLRGHAEKMIRAGVDAEEAERRYAVPKRFENFHIYWGSFGIGSAMRSYYAALGKRG